MLCSLNPVLGNESTSDGEDPALVRPEVESPRKDTGVSQRRESLPRFEFGVAAAALQVPAYPASGVVNDRQFVVPWFIYRSDSVQVKDGGVKLIAYESDRLVIDLGISGSLNSDTSNTPLREGMPDLDFIFELGPRFDVPLLDFTNDRDIRSRVNWITSLRFAVSTDIRNFDYRGPVFNTSLGYRVGGFYNERLSFSASLSTTWLGERLSEYFYSVDPQFVTDTRPEFDAEAGFLNVQLSLGASLKPRPGISTFIGLGFASFAGSENEDSPLFEDDTNTRIIAAFSWRLFKSKRLVRVREE